MFHKKCACRWEMVVLALILATIGFACLINGIVTQWNEPDMAAWWKFGLAYFVGFLFMGLAKIELYKSHEGCTVHRRR